MDLKFVCFRYFSVTTISVIFFPDEIAAVSQGSIAWADYNNDNYQDILITGEPTYGAYNFNNRISKIYKNNGNGTFTDINANLDNVYGASVAWGDYNNDNYIDILLTGENGSGINVSKIYKNNGPPDYGFTDINAGLTGIIQGSVAWADYNDDTYLDILLTGSGISKIYKNNGPPDYGFTDINAGLS